MAKEKIQVTAAGEIQIEEIRLLVLLPEGSIEIDISRVFAEINLFEDLFSNAMYGNILIGDSHNLLDQLSIQGLEGIRIKVRTPGLSDKQIIHKTFGIYALTDQQVLNNDRYQSYRLHFCSLELLNDALNKPLNRSMPSKSDGIDAKQESIIPFIYQKFFVRDGPDFVPRNLVLKGNMMTKEGTYSDLVMGAASYDHTEMTQEKGIYYDDAKSATGSVKIKFIIPNWTPLKSINWVTSRSVPKQTEQAGSFLFYESNKAFHFASINALIKVGRNETAPVFVYKYSPPNLLTPNQPVDSTYVLDVTGEYGRVIKFEFGSFLNLLNSTNMSYFGNQIRAIDPITKRYRELNYSFTADYDKMEHTTDKKPIPIIPKAPNYMLGRKNTVIDTRRNIEVRHREPYFLFDEDAQNPNTNPAMWTSQRAARLASLSTLSMQILVNGRTDMKVGNMITFTFPSLRGEKDDHSTYQDQYYHGMFLVTAIRHFISPIKHQMTLEIIKDTLEAVPDNTTSTDPQGLDYAAGP